tara:strand:+ start:260 stop:868 length:609 start_codon:yes stop_codon:yes gene_type:complete
MKTIRCYINHIAGYISRGSQRDLILEHIKKQYQVKAEEIREALGTELRINKSRDNFSDYHRVVIDHYEFCEKSIKETFIDFKGKNLILRNPIGKKKIEVFWYFNEPDLGVTGELENLFYDLQDSEEYFTTDYNLPKLLPEMGIEKHLIRQKTKEQIVPEILRIHSEYNYSYRKIAEEIEKLHGIVIGKDKVQRTIQKYLPTN